MALDEIARFVHASEPKPGSDDAAKAIFLTPLFGSPQGRYPATAEKSISLRAALDAGVPFVSYIHPTNPTSGAYGGMSIAIFPVEDAPCLITFVVGTNGLHPDEEILG